RDQLNILTDQDILKADIFNGNGQLLYTTNKPFIPTYNLPNGVYVLCVTFRDGKVANKRFVLSR
ncbi:MAG: T9SS type A sorting domain-containing protein, partial [Bacteroidota bacterium]